MPLPAVLRWLKLLNPDDQGPTTHLIPRTAPDDFRAAAREQISKYATTKVHPGTITSITQVDNGKYFLATDDAGQTVTSRKVVLATGMKDILPSTPGLQEAWGKGIYWCPWCDGWEHRDQPFGILGSLSDVMGSVVEMMSLNTDIIAFVNGTHTPAEEARLSKRYPDWEAQLAAYGIGVDNRTITSIERLLDGSIVQKPDEQREFDMFRVNFEHGDSVVRNAFITNFPAVQASNLPADMGLVLQASKIRVDQASMRTSLKGVFAVGDANSDNSTNVPHAMYSGKRAAVFVHVELAREESLASIGKRENELSERELEERAMEMIGDNLEPLWK